MKVKINQNNNWPNAILYLMIMITWISGIVIAKGFWSVTFAIIIPFYAWYLVIERILITNGLIS